ncbi:MAG: glycosyltransferase family 4 protein [Candidatus Buchananbacteria bacterium]
MKILYVITQGEIGGAQLYISALARAAAGQNWDVSVAVGENSGNWLSQQINAKNSQFLTLKHLKRAISPLNDILAVFELAKLYRKIKPDIIHLNSSKAGVVGTFAFWFCPRSIRGKLIYTAHGWVFNEPMNPLKRSLYLWLERLTAGTKHRIICVSEYDRQIGINKKIAKPDKLITIHNGVDFPEDYFWDKEIASAELFNRQPIINGQQFILGTIANFYATKGLNYLIDAIKLLNRKPSALSYKLIIIGEGELRGELERQIKQLELQDDVILAGGKPQAARYLKALDLAVMSSVKEGLPYFILEAMSAGLPIVTTRVGGIPEMIDDGVTGYLAKPRSPESLAEKIKLLADDRIRKQFGEAGLAKVKKEFGLSEMVEKTFATYLK